MSEELLFDIATGTLSQESFTPPYLPLFVILALAKTLQLLLC